LEEAFGEYFLWASADDLFSSNWLESSICSLQSRTGCASFGSACYVDEMNLTFNSTANFINFRFDKYKSLRRIKYIFTPHLTGKMILLHSVFPTNLLRSICAEGIKVTGTNSEDLHFIFLALKNLKFINTKNCFLYKRVHSDSGSAKIILKSDAKKVKIFKSKEDKFERNFLIKIWGIIFPTTELFKFLKKLETIEFVHLIFTFPFFLLYHAIYGACLILRKKVKDVI
jgi:hypothetical protein